MIPPPIRTPPLHPFRLFLIMYSPNTLKSIGDRIQPCLTLLEGSKPSNSMPSRFSSTAKQSLVNIKKKIG
ncbi:hypothetical protein PGB90_003588 [Kerria lacca]